MGHVSHDENGPGIAIGLCNRSCLIAGPACAGAADVQGDKTPKVTGISKARESGSAIRSTSIVISIAHSVLVGYSLQCVPFVSHLPPGSTGDQARGHSPRSACIAHALDRFSTLCGDRSYYHLSSSSLAGSRTLRISTMRAWSSWTSALLMSSLAEASCLLNDLSFAF